MEELIPARLSILGHPQRLAVFRLLMRRYPDEVPAGELAEALHLKASTLSAYLSALQHAGLVTQKRVATSLLYAIDMTQVRRTFDYLLLDCCRGRPELCAPGPMPAEGAGKIIGGRKFNVLFICTGNAARSIFAESILRMTAGERFNAYSAGTRPGSAPHPFAVQVLKDKGHDISVLRSKDVSEFSAPDAPRFDFVFTVCNQAANEECPAWKGQPVTGHWGMPDPALAEGTDAQKAYAFRQAYGALKHRIDLFTALDPAALDRLSLQHKIDDIGRTKIEAQT